MIAARPFATIEELARRAQLPRRALDLLADADACGSLGLDRRQALWETRRIPAGELPLFAAAQAEELALEPSPDLPLMRPGEEVAADYQTIRLSLKGHPMDFARAGFAGERVLTCAATSATPDGRRVRTAGIVLVRQRPGNGNAIFVTLEDETGVTNVVIWARLFERFRRAIMASRLMLVDGVVQRSPDHRPQRRTGPAVGDARRDAAGVARARRPPPRLPADARSSAQRPRLAALARLPLIVGAARPVAQRGACACRAAAAWAAARFFITAR
jgi:error-prone DNA polymerase